MKKVSQPTSFIRIKGAKQHNLKDLDLDNPLNQITVITGLSGSGKSSLAFDTLYAEGQRRYVETFSPYARQFMERMDRPQVERIENIPPAIAIDRKDPVRTSRSTVGTMTELTDYVKLLFARIGQLHCKGCGKPVIPESPEHVWEVLKQAPEGTEIIVTFPARIHPYPALPSAPLKREPGTNASNGTDPVELGRMGFSRFLHGKQVKGLEEWNSDTAEELPIVADRLPYRSTERKRIMDSLEQAFRFGGGRLDVWIDGRHVAFSNSLECAACRMSYKAPIPNLFSFNSPVGACKTCRGFGRTLDVDLGLVIPDPALSIQEGAIKPWGSQRGGRSEYGDLVSFCKRKKIPTDAPFHTLSKEQQRWIIEGTQDYYGIRGFFNWLETKTYKMHVRVYLSRYRSAVTCSDCQGTRFTREALLYRVKTLTIGQIYALSVEQASDFFETLAVQKEDKASLLILDEVRSRLRYLTEVGLGYLTLDRQSRTLSGGEVQRVALTAALGSSLVNTLYILDEPSIGLHPRDNHRLARVLKRLRDLENTVVLVEHDPEIIGQSDLILDLGPGAGEQGGRVMFFGPVVEVNDSLTGQYLKGKQSVPLPAERRKARPGHWLTLKGACENNLKNLDLKIPLRLFVCLTGVSGSGKSTLAEEILYKGVKRIKGDSQGKPGRYRAILGSEKIDDVVLVDQRPIGRTPRANPLTYLKIMDPIRRLLAATQEARLKRFETRHFSFNTPGGRCESCQGSGFEKSGDAVPLRRLHHLPRLRREEVQEGSSRDSFQGKEHS